MQQVQVPGGDSNSPFQDYDGAQPPAFQRENDVADQAHKSSLGLVPGGDSSSPYQDLDGEQGPQFQREIDAASQFHIDSLKETYSYQHGESPAEVNPSVLDYDGNQPPMFQKEIDIADQAHKSSLSAVPGGDSSSPFQDRGDGATPTQYLNNLPN